MSYNFAIVIPPVPADDAAAWAELDALIEQEGPRPTVFQEFHDRLTARFPCICSVPDDEVDDAVWSDGPLINNFTHRAAVLGLSYSRVEEVLPFAIATANNLGLVLFDWATGKIHRSGALPVGQQPPTSISQQPVGLALGPGMVRLRQAVPVGLTALRDTGRSGVTQDALVSGWPRAAGPNSGQPRPAAGGQALSLYT